MIIVTSDHGEEFMDHGGSSHGQTLYDELVRVPLIFKADGLLPRGLRIDAQVELVDVMPTIVSLAGLENEAREMAYQGENLAGWWDPAFKKPSSPYAYLDQNKDSVYVMKAIRTNEWKYIYTEVSPRRDLKKDGPEELYDLKNDKREQLNIIEPAPAIMSALQHQLGEYTAFAQERGGTARKVEIDEATLKQLRALGYVQ
jgi:arylsulfatase A-like enzyme